MPHFVIIPKFISGAIALIFVAMLSMNALTLDIMNNIKKNKTIEQKKVITEEIKELIDDYGDFEEGYGVEWAENVSEDMEVDEEFTQQDLNDMRYESIDLYCDNTAYRGLNISKVTIDYMKNEVKNELGSNYTEAQIFKRYLEKMLIKE